MGDRHFSHSTPTLAIILVLITQVYYWRDFQRQLRLGSTAQDFARKLLLVDTFRISANSHIPENRGGGRPHARRQFPRKQLAERSA